MPICSSGFKVIFDNEDNLVHLEHEGDEEEWKKDNPGTNETNIEVQLKVRLLLLSIHIMLVLIFKSRGYFGKIIRFVIGSSPNLRPWKADVGEESCHTFVDDERLQSQYEQPVPGTEVILKYPFKKIILIPEAPEGVAVDIAFPLLWRLRPQCGGRTRTLQLDK